MADNFNMQGGYFSPPGFLKVETGGSHEENPNGGVQIGVDEQGIPNMLEEGEPVYDDYVYSDNIRADKAILEQFHIPEKYAGKLYSEIADAYVDEAEDRPLDAISNNGLRVMLGRLADAQEQQKANDEQKELEDELANLSPEELAELEQMMSEPEQVAPEASEMAVPEQAAIMPEQSQMMAMGGLLRKFDGGTPGRLVVVPDDVYPDGWGFRSRYFPDNQYNIQTFNIPLPRYAGSTTGGTVTAQTGKAPATLPRVEAISSDTTLLNGAKVNADRYRKTRLGYIRDGSYITEPTIVAPKQTRTSASEEDLTTGESRFATWPRYAGALGHGLLALEDAITPPTRFTSRPYTPQFTPTRMHLQDVRYNPVPLNMYLNPVLQQGAGTVNQIRSAGIGPSTGATIVAADYNTGRNLGQTLLQGIQANEQIRNNAITANNGNATQVANFNYQQNAARDAIMNQGQLYNLRNELILQRLNDEAETQKYAALSQELGYGLDALTKMGDENMAFNMVNSVSPYGYRDKSGRVVYRPASRGGLLLKKYKG